jgi:transcriptional regulator with XRE-family HTH domain
MDVLKAVGQQIRTIRKSQGLSIERLSEKAGITANFLGLVENGRKRSTTTTLAEIAKALNVELATLFETCNAKGKRSPMETEVAALLAVVRTLEAEEVKALRQVAEKIAKKG